MKKGRLWWATWPGALALGVVSLAMVLAGAGPLALFALLATSDASGTDAATGSGPGIWLRLLWVALALASLALPVAVVLCARRKWLGWVLVLFAASGVVLAGGLGLMGIL